MYNIKLGNGDRNDVINVLGVAINGVAASAFYVNPIATTQQPAVTVVQERQCVVYNTTSYELTAGAFNTYSVCYNTITAASNPPTYTGAPDKSFALTPSDQGLVKLFGTLLL